MTFLESWAFWVIVGFLLGFFFGMAIAVVLFISKLSKVRKEIAEIREQSIDY